MNCNDDVFDLWNCLINNFHCETIAETTVKPVATSPLVTATEASFPEHATDPIMSPTIEERKKLPGYPASGDLDSIQGSTSSFLASTDAADEQVPTVSLTTNQESVGDQAAYAFGDVASDDYYQQTSEPSTEQTQTPKTSQRPNNKYQKMKGV